MRAIVRLTMILTVMMSGLVAHAPAQAAQDMGRERAGRYYLESACAAKRAEGTYEWKVWLGRNKIGERELNRRLPEVKRLTRRYALAEQTFVRRLVDPPQAWPDDVASAARRLGAANKRYASTLFNASRAGNADKWIYWIKASYRVDFGKHASIIRERLELPPPGEGCGQLS